MSSAALSNAQLNVHRTPVQVSEVVKQSGAVEKVITIPNHQLWKKTSNSGCTIPAAALAWGQAGMSSPLAKSSLLECHLFSTSSGTQGTLLTAVGCLEHVLGHP